MEVRRGRRGEDRREGKGEGREGKGYPFLNENLGYGPAYRLGQVLISWYGPDTGMVLQVQWVYPWVYGYFWPFIKCKLPSVFDAVGWAAGRTSSL